MRACRTLALICLVATLSGCRMFTRPGHSLSEVSAPDPGPTGLAKFRPKHVRTSFRDATGRGTNETAARALYAEANEQFQQASEITDDRRSDLFAEAAGKYTTAAERWPDSMLQEDSLFMAGEAHFFADQYDDARDAFEKLVKAFPNTRHIDRIDARQFDIAQYWLAVHREDPKFFLRPNIRDDKLPYSDTFGNAVRVFDKIRMDDPTGRLADDATMAAGSAHFARGDYIQAEQFFADLRRTYPESEHQFEAALLGIKAKVEMYQGSDYDSQDLEEATQLIELVFQQFPQEAAEHREFLEETYKDVRVNLAQRDWQTAVFYDNRAQYGGARHYYGKVLQEFPDTSLAQDAQKRLTEIRGLPDKPAQKMEWLVDRIPETKHQHKPLLSGNPFSWLRR